MGTRTYGTARRGRTALVAAVVLVGGTAGGLVGVAGVRPAQAAVPFSRSDPATWTAQQLAGQLVHACVSADDPAGMRRDAALGVGGIALLGNGASTALASQLAAARAAAPSGLVPYVSSDEEGGAVQRLARVVYPLPSAKTMGTWPDAQIEDTAYRYGQRMLALGVGLELAPVADLDVPGAYIGSLDRAFSGDPARVAAASGAWSRGMLRAGVVPVVKHWPGHGSAVDSHTNAAPVVPPLPVLEARDMVPFNAAFAAGALVVMVGHLRSEGLTEPGLPASLSPNALRYLRARTGPSTVIMTDSVTMASASSGIGLTAEQAAVRALQAGVDWALTCAPDPGPTVAAVRAALLSGALPRGQALASARRLVALKARSGLLPAPTVVPAPDLFAVQPTGTGSATVEVHGLSASSGYATFVEHAATALGAVDPAGWRFALVGDPETRRPDLYAVKLRGGSGRVEVHVLSAASHYTQFTAHVATALLSPPAGSDVQVAVGSYAGDELPDLFWVLPTGTGSGRVEVHVLSAASGWQTFVQHAATGLPSALVHPGQWRFLVGDDGGRGDLVGVFHAGTASGSTEVHVLSQRSDYRDFSLHTATVAGWTDDGTSSWALGDPDRDGRLDVVLLLTGPATGTRSTEVHALGGRTAFRDWTLHSGSALGPQPTSTSLAFG